MKIAFVKFKHVPHGGGEGYLARLMAACSERGHEPHLITTAWPEDAASAFQVHALGAITVTRGARFSSFSKRVADFVTANPFDVVMSLDRTEKQDVWRAGEGVHQVWLDRRRTFESPLRSALNWISPAQRTLLRLELACVTNTRVIIANSKMVAEDIRAYYPAWNGRLEIIHNGIDLVRFSTANRTANRARVRAGWRLSPDVPVTLFVGSGFHRKGLRELMEAVSGVPDMQLVVIGRDRAEPWKCIARRMDMEERTHFVEPTDDIVACYHAADIVALPTWFDSFGFVGLEAMACGTPLVATRFAGVHELIVPGVNGSVAGRPDAIDELRVALLDAAKIGRSVAPEAISASVADFSLEQNVDRTLQVLTEVAQR